jgi:hypothetical protein
LNTKAIALKGQRERSLLGQTFKVDSIKPSPAGERLLSNQRNSGSGLGQSLDGDDSIIEAGLT